MKEYLRKNGIRVGIIVAAVVLIIGLGTAARAGRIGFVQNARGTASAPLQKVLSSAANWFDTIYGYLYEYDSLMAENESLRGRLRSQEDQRAALGDAVFSAQEVSRLIIDNANKQAAAILAEAEAIRRRAIFENERQSDYSVQLVESCLRQVREQQAAALETVNAAWQQYLCGLYPEDMPSKPAEEEVPADLSEKVGAIARELEALES